MTLRAGIVGAGGVAGLGFIGTKAEKPEQTEKVRSSHAGGYEAAAGVELVAVTDVDAQKRDRFGAVWDVPEEGRYGSHAEMLAAEDLDVVSVCTPTFLHAEHGIDAVEAVAPDVLWCEKPIAASVSDAEDLVAACEGAGTDLLVNHVRRFDPAYRALRDALDEGLLGDVRAMNSQFKQELLRNGTHYADLVTWLFDADAERVSGFLTGSEEVSEQMDISHEVDDAGGAAMIHLADGSFVSIDCSVSRELWTGYHHFTGTEGKAYVNENDGEWRLWTLEEGAHRPADGALPEVAGGTVPDQDACFANAATACVDLARGEGENPSPGIEAVRSLELLVAVFVSEYTGSHVDLPLTAPLRDATVESW